MSKSSVVIMLFLLSLSTNIAHEAVADSDKIEFKRILDRIDANYDAIYSWQGMATIQRTAYRNTPVGSRPDEQYIKYACTYAFDRRNGNFISTTQLHDEYTAYGKERKHLKLPNENYMRRDQLCYKFSWHSPRTVETLASDGKNLFSSNGVFLRREALILTKPFKMKNGGAPGPTYMLFDPFVKSSFDAWSKSDCDHVCHTKLLRYVLVGMDKRKIVDFAEFEGCSTKLVSQNSQYRFVSSAVNSRFNIESSCIAVFDLKQGGNVVEFKHVLQDATGGQVVQLQEWQCTYENVKGYWVPKRTLVTENFEITRSTETRSTEIVDWHATVINEVIPDSVFTLQNLGLRRGDSVYDQRTEERTVITGDDFSPPFDHAQIPVRQSKVRSVVGSVLFFAGTFLVLLAIFRMYVIWRSNRTK